MLFLKITYYARVCAMAGHWHSKNGARQPTVNVIFFINGQHQNAMLWVWNTSFLSHSTIKPSTWLAWQLAMWENTYFSPSLASTFCSWWVSYVAVDLEKAVEHLAQAGNEARLIRSLTKHRGSIMLLKIIKYLVNYLPLKKSFFSAREGCQNICRKQNGFLRSK